MLLAKQGSSSNPSIHLWKIHKHNQIPLLVHHADLVQGLLELVPLEPVAQDLAAQEIERVDVAKVDVLKA